MDITIEFLKLEISSGKNRFEVPRIRNLDGWKAFCSIWSFPDVVVTSCYTHKVSVSLGIKSFANVAKH